MVGWFRLNGRDPRLCQKSCGVPVRRSSARWNRHHVRNRVRCHHEQRAASYLAAPWDSALPPLGSATPLDRGLMRFAGTPHRAEWLASYDGRGRIRARSRAREASTRSIRTNSFRCLPFPGEFPGGQFVYWVSDAAVGLPSPALVHQARSNVDRVASRIVMTGVTPLVRGDQWLRRAGRLDLPCQVTGSFEPILSFWHRI
jgi:hypothetical protein